MPDGTQLYLELLKKILTNVIYQDPTFPDPAAEHGISGYRDDIREIGLDWPTVAHTMVGRKRLDNVHWAVEKVLEDGVPGDFVETGVWRGGVCILIRAILQAHGVTDRTVWLADSFEGMPVTGEESHEADRRLAVHRYNHVLAVSLEAVKENFARYGLLDDQVKFLKGWFKDTLPTAPPGPLAVIRLDGDLYESTTDALVNLYPRLSPGGFAIIDDYAIGACREAVHDYRATFGIKDEIVPIDTFGVYWRRTD
ncbi:TylF/MycF family methyltransferase [Nonomuraea jabiensis]|uniref:Macrocin O-methyltransferase n=1 Tax=Nonomuraea jabiensis TaxID=882448 RepID=A0A7W9LGR4_9ACTN|nr:TylF/MycF family methyltransferase [Nonomuraea jabiensis]MBB5783209.1 hypothetical protein [Nonomuraea jabiensis]